MRSFAAVALAGVVSAVDIMDVKFIQHVAQYGLSYPTVEEYNFRKMNFAAIDAFIQEENATQVNYQVGHNKFSTWTEHERSHLLNSNRPQAPADRTFTMPERASRVNQVPSTWDWNNGPNGSCVTPIKDQGQCGSCWAFSSTGALEGSHCIVSGGNLLSFSEQQLVDCAGLRWGNYGCNGGLQQYAFNYLEKYFAMSEASYPYTSGTTGTAGTCAYNAANTTGVGVVSWAWTTPYVATGIQAAVYAQPQSISIEANKLCFQFYKTGVLDNTNCGTSLDHAVLMVGYGTDATTGLAYWLVKNSWGTSWGESGYIQLAQVANGDGICGCQMEPLYPTANI
jgi:C1A family cysteine protease